MGNCSPERRSAPSVRNFSTNLHVPTGLSTSRPRKLCRSASRRRAVRNHFRWPALLSLLGHISHQPGLFYFRAGRYPFALMHFSKASRSTGGSGDGLGSCTSPIDASVHAASSALRWLSATPGLVKTVGWPPHPTSTLATSSKGVIRHLFSRPIHSRSFLVTDHFQPVGLQRRPEAPVQISQVKRVAALEAAGSRRSRPATPRRTEGAAWWCGSWRVRQPGCGATPPSSGVFAWRHPRTGSWRASRVGHRQNVASGRAGVGFGVRLVAAIGHPADGEIPHG